MRAGTGIFMIAFALTSCGGKVDASAAFTTCVDKARTKAGRMACVDAELVRLRAGINAATRDLNAERVRLEKLAEKERSRLLHRVRIEGGED